MRFKRLDLNLLVVLGALLRERSVSRAALQLNLSQPAVSSALGRLREYFNDDILTVHGKKMVPTAHAQSIEPLVMKALADIDSLISTSTVFDPATSERTFRICASDYMTLVLLQPFITELERIAPNVRLEISLPTPEAHAKLEKGEIEFLVVPEECAVPEHPHKFLFEERQVVVGWKQNPVFRQPLTEDAFFAQGQVVVLLSHAPSFAEMQMGDLARRRQVEILCPSFLSVPWMLLNSHRLAVIHERLAHIMVKQLPLAVAPLPFPFPVMKAVIQYHATRENDGGIQWMLTEILKRARAMRGTTAAAA